MRLDKRIIKKFFNRKKLWDLVQQLVDLYEKCGDAL
jgi:hypothetical protein